MCVCVVINVSYFLKVTKLQFYIYLPQTFTYLHLHLYNVRLEQNLEYCSL